MQRRRPAATLPHPRILHTGRPRNQVTESLSFAVKSSLSRTKLERGLLGNEAVSAAASHRQVPGFNPRGVLFVWMLPVGFLHQCDDVEQCSHCSHVSNVCFTGVPDFVSVTEGRSNSCRQVYKLQFLSLQFTIHVLFLVSCFCESK